MSQLLLRPMNIVKVKGMAKSHYTIGFDLGGTKLAAALIKQDGAIIDFIKVPINVHNGEAPKKNQTRIIQLMAEIATDFKKRFPGECAKPLFKGVGLASAGPMNVEQGNLIYPANFPGWKIVPLQKLLTEALAAKNFKTQVYFQNDAITSALAESWIGGAKKMKSFCVMTVGTGIGTGVIFNGQPCQSRGAGSEFGHMLVDVKNMTKADKYASYTVEGIASGTALLRRAKEMGFKGASVEELVATQDPRYQGLYEDMAWALAVLCYNLSIGFHLEAIFVSGGLIKIKDLYFKKMQQHYRKLIRDFNPLFECPIAIAQTKNQAGVIGGGYLPYLK